MNTHNDSDFQQHYQHGSSSQLPNMIQTYAYEQGPYYFRQNDRYLPVSSYNGQPLYIQSINNSRGNIQRFPNQEQYQNPTYQIYNQQQIPLSCINNYLVQQPSQQHLPPKLKGSVKPCNPSLVNSQYSQTQILKPSQPQIYLNQNQRMQSKTSPNINVQSCFLQQSQQESNTSQKVLTSVSVNFSVEYSIL